MPPPTLASLPPDILDQLLCTAPDFATLSTLGATCRALRAAGGAHAHSTRRAVAANVCGPAWAAALAAVRAADARAAADAEVRALREVAQLGADLDEEDEFEEEDDDDDEDEDEDGDDDGDEAGDGRKKQRAPRPPLWVSPILPDEAALGTAVISAAEGRALDALGPAAALLEVVFSQRFRDLSVPHSVLSPAEALRFQRAVYLHDTFAHAFGHGGGQRMHLPAADETRRAADMAALLDAHSTEALRALHAVHLLFGDVRAWAANAGHGLGAAHTLVLNISSLSAAQVAALYRGPVAAQDWPMYGLQLLEDALAALGARRGLKPEEWPLAAVGNTFGTPSADLCDHCHISSGPRLYAEPTWYHLTGDLSLARMQALLPGQLNSNVALRAPLAALWTDPILSSARVIASMFDGDDGGGGWARADRLCIGCVEAFVREHIVVWCRRELITRGANIPDDRCWYGWNCWTQRKTTTDHAQRLDHLCVATRGN